MALSTAVGSFPGATAEAYAEWVKAVFGSLSLPVVPELPGRGVHGGLTGRGLATVAGLAADLQPSGWRLAGSSGIDQRRARSLLAQDLDAVEELAAGWSGPVKTQVAGPWTLAATVELPRGDKVLGDHGARRELAQALAEGLRSHVADLRRRLPEASRLVVQLDEPVLGPVLAGVVPTASGLRRLRSIDRAELSGALDTVLDAVRGAGARAWVHSCAADTPWDLVAADGLVADLSLLDVAAADVLAGALERGRTAALGVVPAADPDPVPGDKVVTERVLRFLEMLGLDPSTAGDRLVVTSGCGHAGASADWARRGLELARTVADNLA